MLRHTFIVCLVSLCDSWTAISCMFRPSY